MALAASGARAGDGVAEINQTCATQTGCFPTDAPGFPVSIPTGTSARLTGDLSVTTLGPGGIEFWGNGTLDLGGFSVVGPVTCTGTPAVCNDSGFSTYDGVGILAAYAAVTVRNGRVAGFRSAGVMVVGGGARVENVVVESNAGYGIRALDRANQIVGCRVIRNGYDGINSFGRGAQLIGNVVNGNGQRGIDAGRALILDNTAHSNGDEGLMSDYAEDDSGAGRNGFANNNGGSVNPQADIGGRLGANACGSVACP